MESGSCTWVCVCCLCVVFEVFVCGYAIRRKGCGKSPCMGVGMQRRASHGMLTVRDALFVDATRSRKYDRMRWMNAGYNVVWVQQKSTTFGKKEGERGCCIIAITAVDV
jgi:hypothetical protein